MTLSEAGQGIRFKAVAPVAAAALAAAAAIAGGTLLFDGAARETTAADAPPTAAAPPAPNLPPGPPQGAVPGVQFDQFAPGAAPQGAQLDMEIVVKFKDDAKVKEIVDAFWRDQSAAREKFESFKAGRPELANLQLDRVTYSNELVLVHEDGGDRAARLAAMREIAAKLKTAADISYAEPNMTAHPGGQ